MKFKGINIKMETPEIQKKVLRKLDETSKKATTTRVGFTAKQRVDENKVSELTCEGDLDILSGEMGETDCDFSVKMDRESKVDDRFKTRLAVDDEMDGEGQPDGFAMKGGEKKKGFLGGIIKMKDESRNMPYSFHVKSRLDEERVFEIGCEGDQDIINDKTNTAKCNAKLVKDKEPVKKDEAFFSLDLDLKDGNEKE